MFQKSPMSCIDCLLAMFMLDETRILLTNWTCVVSFHTIPAQISISRKVIDSAKYHRTQAKGVTLIGIIHINLVHPQFSQVFNQRSQVDINIVSWLSWTLNNNH